MKKHKIRNGLLLALLFLVIGTAVWWWIGSLHPNPAAAKGTPQNIVSTASHKAMGKVAKMTLKSASMTVTGIEGDKVHVKNTVVIANPLPVAVNLTGLDFAVSINGTKAAEGHYDKPLHLPTSGTQTIVLPMNVSISALKKINDRLKAKNQDTADYTFASTIYTDLPIAGERKFDLKINDRLPAMRLPEIKPGGIAKDKFGFKHTGIDMTMQVTNPNVFALRMKDGKFSMTINDEQTVTGTMQKVVSLPPKSTVPVSMHTDMKTGKALKMGWKMLFKKKDTRYKMVFDSKIVSKEKMLQNSTMHFTDKGTLDDITKALKKK